MGTYGNNSNAERSNIRDSFFVPGERKFFDEIMKYSWERHCHDMLTKIDAGILCEKAINLIERAEAGEFDEEHMKDIEYKIAHYLGAIEDLTMVIDEDDVMSIDEDDVMEM